MSRNNKHELPGGSPSVSSDLVVHGEHTYESITDKISSIVLTRTSPGWYLALGFSALLVLVLIVAITTLFVWGIGIWGVNIPVAWGWAIVNFVWWIGIGHAGTLISAILLLLRQQWRTSINRFAEAMTLFAVSCAGLFPLLHLGRPQFFYWLVPYPNVMSIWPQFRSPLIWDFFAVLTYATVSFLFWYIGLIPDLSTLRDRAKGRLVRVAYGMLSLGWRGSASQWERYNIAYLLLAGLATPLVVSVHTVVSFDFAVGIIPGWHSTIFPPYFVAGAIFSGFAMVLTLAIPLRAIYKLHDFITMWHLENMGKVILAMGLIVSYGYFMEIFMAWYSDNHFEWYMPQYRALGEYKAAWWALVFCNVLSPQVLWIKKVRTSTIGLFTIAMIVNVGMWLERYVIVVTSLSRDYIPSSWHMYSGTVWDWLTFIGSIGLFLFLFVMFIRLLPMISMAEMRELLKERKSQRQTEAR